MSHPGPPGCIRDSKIPYVSRWQKKSGGGMRSIRHRGLAALLWLLVSPTLAYAQASITGVVRDSSGAVLPGVSVEASSPALIEGTKTVVTDATGQYRIVDLRPGVYAVSFSLSGFSTFKRDGI